MTEDDLYPLLAPLAGGQVYPYVAPLGSDGSLQSSAVGNLLDHY
jgi:hypothetical protein